MELPRNFLECPYGSPNIRYIDTSYIIFQKWLQDGEKNAFPLLAHYNSSAEKMKRPLNESQLSNNEYKQIDQGYRKKRRSLSDSSDKGEYDVQNPTDNTDMVIKSEYSEVLDGENISLHIVEPNPDVVDSNRSSVNSQNGQNSGPTYVKVDIHQSPDTKMSPFIKELIDNNQSHAKENVPDELLSSPNFPISPNECDTPLQHQNHTAETGTLILDSTDSALIVQKSDLNTATSLNELQSKPAKPHNDNGTEERDLHYAKSQSFPVRRKSLQNHSSKQIRLQYITQRILASILPKVEDDGSEINKLNDQYELEVISMLEQKHGKNYRIFDLQSCISIITLEKICELCKHIDSWLNTSQDSVVVLQDRGDRQRLGTAISAYLKYLDICSRNNNYKQRNGNSNEDDHIQDTITKNWLDLDIFSMKKFLEDAVGPLTTPSHRRYLEYFSGLLSGNIRMNAAPVCLKIISIESPPIWLHYDNSSLERSSEWITFIKIYEGLRCIYTSDIHILPVTTRQFFFQIGNLRLRGDIMIRCYQITSIGQQNGGYKQEARELLFSLQFHTCIVKTDNIVFRRNDMDLAYDDSRFPSDHKTVLYFGKTSSDDNTAIFQSPLIQTLPPNEIAKYDSVEQFDTVSSYHTQGPIDGSLYAKILKSPKSPQSSISLDSHSIQKSRSSFLQNQTYPGQNLISPPPQFSNRNSKESLELTRGGGNSSIPQATNNTSLLAKVDNSNYQTISRLYDNFTETPKLPSTQPINYRESQKYVVPINLNPSETRDITIVETFNNSTDKRYQHGGKDRIQNPLTLSMDSGISSSGVLNKPPPGSSVSPSSFLSQPSPQEDRDRELDDILSDMLMTVQDIPDVNSSSLHTITRSQSAIPTTGNYAVPARYNSNLHQSLPPSAIRRSHSYNIEQSLRNNFSYIPKDRHQDIYDTTSTATTLTPPLSESGLETPPGELYCQSDSATNTILRNQNRHHYQTAPREKREIYSSLTPDSQSSLRRQHQYQPQQQQHQQQMIMMSLHQQSSIHPQNEQIESAIVSGAEDDEIPYHAREYSQPFSYGSVPLNSFSSATSPSDEDPTMIKPQSGLSSPSLVRKTLRAQSPFATSSSTTSRKTPQRVDFEDMLRDRREKVMSEKYSKSDQFNNHVSSMGSRSFDDENQWSYSSRRPDNRDIFETNRSNRPYNEPLRRSNTMDGWPAFIRSTSTDGIAGQTWLQLQQQKLRAKKDQQVHDNRRYFEEVIHNEIKSKPFRSRNILRNDGYASDTAAFVDEVDYRRPLEIQTPNYRRLPHETYTTKTITTTAVTKERPFVAVKRAHDQARQASSPSSPLTLLRATPNGHINQMRQPEVNGRLLSMTPNHSDNEHMRLVREESFSSYRSETDPEFSINSSPRPETPAFPVTPRTPYGLNANGSISPALPPKSPTSLRHLYNSNWSLRSQKSSLSSYDLSKDLYSGNQKGHLHEVVNQNETISCYASRPESNSSNVNSEPQEIAPHLIKFVRDSSKYWYKPNISREEAVILLRRAEPGTFLVRDSTTYKNAFGLVLRVAQPPPGVELKTSTGDELVRHFLVEPTLHGVRLKGCNNEPVFSSLSALVYQHSITPLALPCRLIIPDRDIQSIEAHSPAQRQLLAQGAACNVLHLFTCDTESLTGEEAIRKAVAQLLIRRPLPQPIEVHFKASQQGITLTDTTRCNFFSSQSLEIYFH